MAKYFYIVFGNLSSMSCTAISVNSPFLPLGAITKDLRNKYGDVLITNYIEITKEQFDEFFDPLVIVTEQLSWKLLSYEVYSVLHYTVNYAVSYTARWLLS